MKRAKIFGKGNGRFKLTKKKIAVIAVILVCAIVCYVFFGRKKDVGTIVSATDDIVTRGDIDVTITGSASVEPYERYEIIPKVSGDVIYCPYEVGDTVSKDDVLYRFDSSDSDLTVERQKISMQQSQNSYERALEESEKLSVKTETSGVVSELNVNVGDEIKQGTRVATITDTTVLEVELPFTQAQIGTISVGDSAAVTSSKHMSEVSGSVVHISNTSYAGNDGSALYNVRVRFDNPGAFYAGMEVGGRVGENISPASGVVENKASGEVTSEITGHVAKINCSNGDYITKGSVVVTLISDDLSDQIEDSTLSYKSAQVSMQQTEKTLEDYKITSPISGTVITKNTKAGDTIDKTNSTTTMMVIADISKLKFELAIDELDVENVNEGQEVMITCDAVPNETFKGIITNVSVEGSAQNGVTTYSAEVEIPEPGLLRPSMNIDAVIIVDSAEDVLMVPSADVTAMGDRNFVFVKDTTSKANAAEDNGEKENVEGKNERKSGEKRDDMPENADNKMPESRTAPDDEDRSKKDKLPGAPDGYRTVEIVTGIANEDYTEVITGLTEGQEIYSKQTTSSSNESMMPNMAGGMAGGMGGGMPGGMGGGPGGMR